MSIRSRTVVLLAALLGLLAPAAAAAAPLKVSSYNINDGVGVDGRLDLDRTAAAIAASGADVIGLQAVDKHWSARSRFLDEPAELARRLNMHVVYAPNLDNAPLNAGEPRRQYGVAILSRVRVATTHLHTTAAEREAQVAAILAKLAGSAEPVVVTGVLNAAPSAPELAPIPTAYRDTWALKGSGDGLVFPAVAPTTRSAYVLASKGVGVLSAALGDRAASTYIPITTELDPTGATGDTSEPDPIPTPTATPNPDPGGGAHPDAPGTPLNVAAYNIAHGRGFDAQGTFAFDLDRTIGALRAIGTDVLALQEVDRHFGDRSLNLDEPAVLAEALGMHVVYAPNLDLDPPAPGQPRRQYGTATLSRHPILTSRNTLLPRPSNGEQRGLLEAVIDVNGLRVRIANTHLSTVATERGAQVARIVELLADSAEPVVLLGDLNAVPAAPELAPLWGLLRDTWTLGGVGNGMTFPTLVPDRRIDYIAVSDSVNVRSARVPDTIASDHRPVAAELAITTRTSTPGSVGGTVPATLALTLGPAASFGALTPGVARTYTTSTSATVTSTAGAAALTVSEPGHLRNGAFSLPQPLQVSIDRPAFDGPVTNAPVAIGFSQPIGAGDALRTGTYGRSVTFTLSTTTP